MYKIRVTKRETSSSTRFNLDSFICVAHPPTTIGKGQYKIIQGIKSVSLLSALI